MEISCNGRCQTTSSTSSYQDKPFHEPIKSTLHHTQIKITFPLLLLLLWFFIYSITINYVVGKTVECHFFLFPTCLKKWRSLIFICFCLLDPNCMREQRKKHSSFLFSAVSFLLVFKYIFHDIFLLVSKMVAVTTRRFKRLTLLGYLFKCYRDGLSSGLYEQEVYGIVMLCTFFILRIHNDIFVWYVCVLLCPQWPLNSVLIDQLMFLN